MENERRTGRINIVDVLIALILVAVVAYVVVSASGVLTDKKPTVDNKVEVTLSPTDNFGYLSAISVGDEIYLDDCTEALGTVSEISISETDESAVIRVTASFPHDAEVYTVDGVLVARGKSYTVRTKDCLCGAYCTGVRPVSVATLRESEE